jgi:hypothetical protein
MPSVNFASSPFGLARGSATVFYRNYLLRQRSTLPASESVTYPHIGWQEAQIGFYGSLLPNYQ